MGKIDTADLVEGDLQPRDLAALWGSPPQRSADLPRREVAGPIDPDQENAAVTSAPGCLHDLFEAQVRTHASAPALVCGDRVLSYAELDSAANQLAHYLRSKGVVRGSLIGLCLDRGEQPIIAILACLKAGGAYVPIDPSYPGDRIRHIVEEADLALLISQESLLGRIRDLFGGPIVSLDGSAEEIATWPTVPISRAEIGVTPDDLCYVIYTSGTTGRPKGVMTEHRNVHHFVLAFNSVCTTTTSDRIYQGFSLSFDGSVEEMWMAFSNGAALVVGTKDTPRFGNDLARYLAQAEITYFSTVPTMLSTMTEEIPTLRQLVVSGEICAPGLVARWARPRRLVLNVYGPTEATVNTTAKVCVSGEPITIGRPLPGYAVLILDAEMRPVRRGSKGELYVAGPGVARGYLKQTELTSRHFVRSLADAGRLYRTGDLAAINESGEVEFFGRADDQVKIRGYRVELSEISNVLLEQPNVASAAVTVKNDRDVPELAAYITLENAATLVDRSALLKNLRAKLPAYMIPSYLDVLSELPMLSTGKVDRKRLPAPTLPLIEDEKAQTPPGNAMEASIADAWAAVFNVKRVGVEQDFFLDLGGHSLLAAQMVARLRSSADLHISVRDVYAFPTVRKLAEHLSNWTPKAAEASPTPANQRDAGAGVATLQALLMAISWYAFSTPAFVVLPVADDFLRERIGVVEAVLFLTLFFIALAPLMLILGLGAKWLIVGRYKPGVYPLWGSYYIRCWLAGGLQRLFSPGPFLGTPLLPLYYRLMGAKVGRDCMLDTALVTAWDLISIGDGTSIGADTQLPCARVENGNLILGRVEIGGRCFIGSHAALGLDVRMGDDCRLDDHSLLPDGTVLSNGEQRRGSPAERAPVPVPSESAALHASFARKAAFVFFAWLIGQLTAATALVPAVALLLLWRYAFQQGWIWACLGATAALMPVMIVVSCLWVVALKTVLLRRARPGVYSLYSVFHLRHWLAYGLMRSVRNVFLPIFTTVYLPPWLRLFGAKIGKHAEMSTIWSFMPELLDAGDSAFFADGCMLGGRRVFGGRFEIAINHVGNRSFIGNGAFMPSGASLGDGCLLGVLSVPPFGPAVTPDGTDWLGSPAFQLPNRQRVGGFAEVTTYLPTTKLYVQRAAVDALRILIPAYTAVGLGLAYVVAVLFTYESLGIAVTFGLLPIFGLATAALAVAIVVILKWMVMGRFVPVIVPLWCRYVWFNEMVNGAYESIMAPVVSTFFGTPFAAPLLRLLGCKIGRHCYIGSALFSEFDLVKIGDRVALNSGAVIQNHLFEDRIMKSSFLTIEDGCSVGNMSVVLYDSHMMRGATLGPLSLLMKGEVMPQSFRGHGIPTVQACPGAPVHT